MAGVAAGLLPAAGRQRAAEATGLPLEGGDEEAKAWSSWEGAGANRGQVKQILPPPRTSACEPVVGDFVLTLRKRLSVSNAGGWFDFILGGWPISSLGSAAVFAHHPAWLSVSFIKGSPTPRSSWLWAVAGSRPVDSGRCRLFLPQRPVGRCLQVPSTLGTGDFPRLGRHFTCLTGALLRRRRSHTQPHCIFLVSRLSWKKKNNPTRLPDFDSLAQPMLIEASGAGLVVTSRCTWAWLH